MRLILVRHGQAEHRGDEPDDLYLTELGKRQVELLGQWLAENETDIDAIISSPLRRARETTSILNRYISAPVKVDDDLRETTHDLLEKLPRLVHPSDSGPHYYMMPANNYYQRFAEQVRRVLNRILDNPAVDPDQSCGVSWRHGGHDGAAAAAMPSPEYLDAQRRNALSDVAGWAVGFARRELRSASAK